MQPNVTPAHRPRSVRHRRQRSRQFLEFLPRWRAALTLLGLAVAISLLIGAGANAQLVGTGANAQLSPRSTGCPTPIAALQANPNSNISPQAMDQDMSNALVDLSATPGWTPSTFAPATPAQMGWNTLPGLVVRAKTAASATAYRAIENGRVATALANIASFGHLLYKEADPTDLMVIASYSVINQRFERMQHDAGLSLMRMIDAARGDGVWLVPISGFRDVEEQGRLFDYHVELRGTPERAAKSVAPPGHSEHHTGLAIDLADGLARATDVSVDFQDTDGYRWLQRHAAEFGYELSFPPDNPQGVNYEPWHWRFVGTPQATTLFTPARMLNQRRTT